MTDFSKFAETELPPKEEFNKWLNSGAVSKSGRFDEIHTYVHTFNFILTR